MVAFILFNGKIHTVEWGRWLGGTFRWGRRADANFRKNLNGHWKRVLECIRRFDGGWGKFEVCRIEKCGGGVTCT